MSDIMTTVDYALIGYVLTHPAGENMYALCEEEARAAIFPTFDSINELKEQRKWIERAVEKLDCVFERVVDHGFVYWRLR